MEWMEVINVIDGNTKNFENCIYMWRNKVNKKLYVGQAKDFRKRTMQHKNRTYNENSKYDYNLPLHRAIRKYGIENFEICILEFDLNDYDKMNEKEIFYIEKFDTLSNNKKGYNLSSGGGNGNPYAGKTEGEMDEIRKKMSESQIGKHHSEETKQKISEAQKGENSYWYGKHHSEETKRKMSDVQKGKQLSEKHKQKLSENHADVSGDNNWMYGKHHSEESKRKMREANSGKNHPRCRKIICITTGEVFDYIKQAEEKYKVRNISSCCCGKKKSTGKHPETGEKLVWMHYEDFLKTNGDDKNE